MAAQQIQTQSYWAEWAKRRGAYYFSVRAPHETAEFVAPCISDDPVDQAAFVEGWREAETKNHALRKTLGLEAA